MRTVAPLDLPTLTPAALTGSARPAFDLVNPRELLVDDDYQRSLSPRSIALIRRIVEGFRWSKFKPPVCVRVDGRLHVIDGQHTSVACASHPGITAIPVIVVDEPEKAGRAQAFVSHACDRLAATPGQVWQAEVAAGGAEALTILRVCEAAGVKLLPFAPAGSAFKVGETIALSTIKGLVRRRGAEKASLVLAALADSDLAPITGESIKAAEALLNEPDYAADFDVERLAASFRALGPRAVTEAKELAAAKGLPMWRALVATIYRHRKGRSGAAASVSTEKLASSLPTRRVIDRRPPGGPVPMGEPPAGRSALDQRRSGL